MAGWGEGTWGSPGSAWQPTCPAPGFCPAHRPSCGVVQPVPGTFNGCPHHCNILLLTVGRHHHAPCLGEACSMVSSHLKVRMPGSQSPPSITPSRLPYCSQGCWKELWKFIACCQGPTRTSSVGWLHQQSSAASRHCGIVEVSCSGRMMVDFMLDHNLGSMNSAAFVGAPVPATSDELDLGCHRPLAVEVPFTPPGVLRP